MTLSSRTASLSASRQICALPTKPSKNCAVLLLDTLTSLFDQIYIQRDLVVFNHADTLVQHVLRDLFIFCQRVHREDAALKFIQLSDALLRIRLKYFYAYASRRRDGRIWFQQRLAPIKFYLSRTRFFAFFDLKFELQEFHSSFMDTQNKYCGYFIRAE